MGNTRPFDLDKHSFPFRLYQKSKRNGLWDPESIDFTRDRTDWRNMNSNEQLVILKLVSMFYSGEHSVTEELIPLIYAVEKDGRIEETMFLTAFLFEEAKHAEFFFRFVQEVIQSNIDPYAYQAKGFQRIIYKELPLAMKRLLFDQSPEAFAIAATTYQMVVEDITGEIGFHYFFQEFGNHGMLPGLQKGLSFIARDEGRHVAYGIYLIQRLIREHGDRIFEAVKNRYRELVPICIETLGSPFGPLVTERANRRLKMISKACTVELQEDVF